MKSNNTRFETQFFKELRREGVHFRTNVKDLVGKPDLAIKKYTMVVFLDSCFWHACPNHYEIPKTNKKFWEEKLFRNRRNDAKVTQWYKRNKWTIIRIWEHAVNINFDRCVKTAAKRIKCKIASSKIHA
ncbi:MAG: very short patch repair endonuclease [Atribacterota bacterium]|nr:very short patch repair endonuclease [Atribacterota bacterium]